MEMHQQLFETLKIWLQQRICDQKLISFFFEGYVLNMFINKYLIFNNIEFQGSFCYCTDIMIIEFYYQFIFFGQGSIMLLEYLTIFCSSLSNRKKNEDKRERKN